jgi:hypothetical protein
MSQVLKPITNPLTDEKPFSHHDQGYLFMPLGNLD